MNNGDSMLAISPFDLEQLRTALQQADAQTQAFVGPLLPLRAVQHVLLSFLRDNSRSFTDWVWDPSVRQLLNQLRAQNPQAHHHAQDVDRWFAQATQDQWTLKQQQAPTDLQSVRAQRLQDADAAQQDGKRKFQARDYYAAKNAFEKSLAQLTVAVETTDINVNAPLTVSEWPLDQQQRYVTLCTNIAVCGLKLLDLSLIRLYAAKVLAVDPHATKALYATAKLHLLEHAFGDAAAVVTQALATTPHNVHFVNLQREIDAALARDEQQRAALTAAAQQATAEAAEQLQQQTERQQQRDAARVTASDFVPLPTLEDDAHAVSRLNVYCQRIKHTLDVAIVQLHDPERSEPPLFTCRITDATTDTVLATDVRGASKKAAKSAAAFVAIETLWAIKTATNTLLEEDVAYQKQLQTQKQKQLSAEELSDTTEQQPAPPQSVQLFTNERSLDPVQLLQQLKQQNRLHIAYKMEDLAPESKTTTSFQSTIWINHEVFGIATAPAMKKAKHEAAKRAVATAIARNVITLWDPETLERDDADTNEVKNEMENEVKNEVENEVKNEVENEVKNEVVDAINSNDKP